MRWYYLSATGDVVGPLSEQALREFFDAGDLQGTSLVCQEGSEDWIELTGVFETRTESSGMPAEDEATEDWPDESVGNYLSASLAGDRECASPDIVVDDAGLPPVSLENETSNFSAAEHVKAGWSGVKRNSKIAALNARIEKLRNVDLRRAYQELGRRCYDLGLQEGEFSQLFGAIREVEAKIVANRESERAPENEKKADTIKRMTRQATKAAKAKSLELKLPPLHVELGRLVFARRENDDLAAVGGEADAVASIEAEIKQIKCEIEGVAGEIQVGESRKDGAEVATMREQAGHAVGEPPTETEKAPNDFLQTAQPKSPDARKNNRFMPVVIGCGAAAILSLIILVGIFSLFVGGGNGGASSDQSRSAGSSGDKMMTCMRCKGSGQQQVPCRHCHGTRVMTTRQGFQMTCPNCQGLGVASVACGGCNGLGTVRYSRENLYTPSNKPYNPDLPLDLQ